MHSILYKHQSVKLDSNLHILMNKNSSVTCFVCIQKKRRNYVRGCFSFLFGRVGIPPSLSGRATRHNINLESRMHNCSLSQNTITKTENRVAHQLVDVNNQYNTKYNKLESICDQIFSKPSLLYILVVKLYHTKRCDLNIDD